MIIKKFCRPMCITLVHKEPDLCDFGNLYLTCIFQYLNILIEVKMIMIG